MIPAPRRRATFRSGEAAPDAIRQLWKDLLPRVDLAPLELDDVRTVLEAHLGGPIEAATVHAIHTTVE